MITTCRTQINQAPHIQWYENAPTNSGTPTCMNIAKESPPQMITACQRKINKQNENETLAAKEPPKLRPFLDRAS